MSTPTPNDIIHTLNVLSKQQLVDAITPYFPVPSSCSRSKPRLLQFIAEQAPLPIIQRLQSEAENQHSGRRRKLPGVPNPEPRPKTFLCLPSDNELRRCYREFYKGTTTEALARKVCSVCAREDDIVLSEGVAHQVPVAQIPNSFKLKPQRYHPAYNLRNDGLLLEDKGLFQRGHEEMANICKQCYSELKLGGQRPPPFSLANNLWIGPIPTCLSTLSFCETLLISLFIPRIFVFKLYPKSHLRDSDPEELQRGMRGNVVSYEQDIQGVSAMVTGNLLPRPLSILATVITIAFVGKGKLSLKSLTTQFRVRREPLRMALQFLKECNPHYGHIVIDERTLTQMPDNDIPQELSALVRHYDNDEEVERETQPYVPNEDVEEAGDVDNPAVFPLNISGGIDVNMNNISPHDLLKSGIANMWASGQEGAYVVRHGSKPVTDFPLGPNPSHRTETEVNYWAKAFPTLYPYGVGTPDSPRPIYLDLRAHTQWALRYHDRRFRRHETFPFVVHGILQRRQCLMSSRIQMNRCDFERQARTFAQLGPEYFQQAIEEERQHKPFSNIAVRNLIQQIRSVSSRVAGSNSSKFRLRSQSWATMFWLNPGSLWMTINPTDLHDPVAQILAGEEIDMNRIHELLSPSAKERARNIAADPYAAAQFFHYIIRLTLRTLFQIETTSYQVKSDIGVLGELSGYFGVVESQGRGSLHLHMLLWLKNAPTSQEMHRLLGTAQFRDQVRAYIAHNIHGYVPGLESEESIRAIPNVVDVGFRRRLNPDAAGFEAEKDRLELSVARSKQMHTCSQGRCLTYNRQKRQYVCKRRAPFQCAVEAFIEESGHWGPKRLYNMVNAYCPHLSVTLFCNNDLKFITNGEDSKNIIFYYTTYMAKNQPCSTNCSTLLAKQYAFEEKRLAVDPRYLSDLSRQQQMLLFRLANRLTSEQEMSGPMVISLLMNWGDHFTSHRFTSVYWTTFVGYLIRTYPDLKREAHVENLREQSDGNEENVCIEEGHNEEHCDSVDLMVDPQGIVAAKNQVMDYRYRGELLKDYNVYAFFKDTWEDRDYRSSGQTSKSGAQTDPSIGGRPLQQRILYLPEHPAHQCHCRVLRSSNHNNLPNFIGQFFPRSDDPSQRNFYCASMLLLFQPWRNLGQDLKSPNESWEAAWTRTLREAPPWVARVVDNIQYYYESRQAAEDVPEEVQISQNSVRSAQQSSVDIVGQRPDDRDDEDEIVLNEDWELEMRELAEINRRGPDDAYAQAAVSIGEVSGLFPSNLVERLSQEPFRPVHIAQGQDLARLANWQEELNRQDEEESGIMDGAPIPLNSVPPAVFPLTQLPDAMDFDSQAAGSVPRSIPSIPALGTLNQEQRRAFDIVRWYLDSTLAGCHPSPMRMQLIGAGGVGKSRVIEAITQLFEARNVSHLLARAAFTGIAAMVIQGRTLHSLCRIPIRGGGRFTITNKQKKQLIAIFRHILFLIIDELSMLWKEFLAILSHRICVAKAPEDSSAMDKTFGGLHVMIAGDLHQFPPVGVKRHDVLYKPLPMYHTSTWTKTGDVLYHEFDKVVILTQQIRVQDAVWQGFLDRLRVGRVQRDDLDMLRSLVVKPFEFQTTPGEDNPWLTAPLITPRHSVRRAWNSAAIRRHCLLHNQQLFLSPTYETIDGEPLTDREKRILKDTIRTHQQSGNRNDLPDLVELAVGSQVLVTRNLDTEQDVANGARGEIVDIILDPDEPPVSAEREVRLKYPPSYVLVKLSRTRGVQLPGLPPDVVPIEPVVHKMSLKIGSNSHGRTPLKRQVLRRQLPMTGAYAFTDYRSQGQTLGHVIVDVARPATGPGLSLFNLYVALSRSKGRSTIRLLRSFEDQTFLQSVDPDLLVEDARLERLAQQTQSTPMF